MKYLIPSERSDVWEFIIHVFGNDILPMKHAVRHTWLLHRLCTSRHILARVYHVHGKNCRSLWKSLNFFVRPCSCCLQNINSSCISFWSTTTQTLKAEGRLTRLWIHLIVVQNNLLSGVSRLVVPSHQLPIHQLKGEKSKGMVFSLVYVLLLPKHRFSHITSCWQY